MEKLEIAASTAVEGWLELARAAIDGQLGKGTAEAHPELIGAYIQACASQYRNLLINDNLLPDIEGLRVAISDVRDALDRRE